MNENINMKQKRFIINESAKLFYYKGYNNTSLTNIFESCNITNDIFFMNFATKNELLIEVIKFHTKNLIEFFNKVVDDLSIVKLREFFKKYFETIERNRFHGGSPLGNLALEISDINDEVRVEIGKSYKKLELRISFFLTTLKYSSNQYKDLDTEIYARLLISLLEGTMLRLKVEKSNLAAKDFFKLFDSIFIQKQKDLEDNSNKKLVEENTDTSNKFSEDHISENQDFLNPDFENSSPHYSDLDKVKVSKIVTFHENDTSQKNEDENLDEKQDEINSNPDETTEDLETIYEPIFSDDEQHENEFNNLSQSLENIDTSSDFEINNSYDQNEDDISSKSDNLDSELSKHEL